MNTTLKRWVTRLVILSMINPATVVPGAFARDTDIYSGFQATSATSVKPNILLVLDTSDSMNIPEGWREYEGAYDSHVEYLWADAAGIIGSTQTALENSGRIALGMISVSSITASGVDATVTTTANHGFAAGWSVTISGASPSTYNGIFLIASVPSTTTFTVTLGATPATTPATKSLSADGVAVTSITQSGTTATVTQTAHGRSVGSSVKISGASDPYYNGTFTITAITANTYTYTMLGTPGANAAAAMYAMAQNPVPSSQYGFWAGTTPEQRMQLWRAAYDSAIAQHPDDPAGYTRESYRNYNNANWIYWLPAGTVETDARLRSPSFNRWAGGVKRVGGSRGGISFGSNDDFRDRNKCTSSLAPLYPSTIFAPTDYERNTGKYLNQQWQRWENWVDLRNGRITDGDTVYPITVGTTTTPSSGSLPIAAGSLTGNVGSNIRANNEYLGSPATAGTPVRDSWPRSPGFGNNTDIGSRGQPIRTQISGTSRSAWVDLKADLGGFNFADSVNGYNSTVLVNTLKSYQANYYGVTPSTTNAISLAWKGNRDQSSTPAFGSLLGTPAYYDNPATNLKLGTATTTVCTRTCVVDSDPGTAGTQGIFSASPLRDGNNTTKYWYKSGATCVSTGTSGTDCSTPPGACGNPSANGNYVTANHNGCAWSGREFKYVEGEGTYSYGGTCSGTCTGQGNTPGGTSCSSGASSTDYCTISGLSTVVRGSTSMVNAVLNGGGNGTNTGCGTNSDISQTCATRQGSAGCSYSDNIDPCNDPAVTTSGAATDYSVYSLANRVDYLYHDCKADNGTTNGITSNTNPTYLSSQNNSSFGVGFPTTPSVANMIGSNKPYVTTNPGVSYPAVDMYSVNYLNWKFGPRGPKNHPIGRKTRLQIAKDVLTDVVQQLYTAKSSVNIGLMSFNQMESLSPKNSSGAHLDKAVLDICPRVDPTDVNSSCISTNMDSLITKINALKASAATPLTESLYEAYQYFKGETPKFGSLTVAANIGGGPVNAGVDTSTDAMVGTKYKSPITQSCQENLVILVSDGAPENDDAANSEILGLPTVAGVSVLRGDPAGQIKTVAGIPYGPKDTNPTTSGNDYVLLDELAYYMANTDAIPNITLDGYQKIKLSTISFAGVDAPVLTKAATEAGGSAYSASDAADLQSAILAAIQAVSQWQPQAASPAVTYNVTAGASEDAYIGAIFPGSNVAWQGTVKKYKFGFEEAVCGPASCGNPKICLTGQTVIDTTCQKNIEKIESDPVLGVDLRKIRAEAASFWSSPILIDGGIGTSGGTGQVLIDPARQPGGRKLYTFLTGVSTSVALSDPGNAISTTNAAISATRLGNAAMTATDRETLIQYALGSDGSNVTNWRTWAQYDAVHSRPLADLEPILPDPTPLTPQTIPGDYLNTLFFLTSDGVVHAVDSETGIERWAFMVEEGLGQINAMKTNNVGDHLEVADGNPVILTTADDKKLLVFGMRRGGRAYYALDITSVVAPKFAWKITNTQTCSGTTCSASINFTEMGYAWSTPNVGTVRGHKSLGVDGIAGTADDKFKPVLIFGGGYDNNQDSATPVADTMGRAIFVVDAASGNLIKKFSTISGTTGYSVPADVLALDTTGDAAETIDRVYAGDMGGNLWRMDLDDRTVSNDPANWSIVQLAKLGIATKKNKLFNRPTMAPSIYRGQVFDAVFIGGGDLQQPTANTAELSGSMFMVKDFTVSGVAAQASTIPDIAVAGNFVDMTTQVAANALETVTNTSAAGSTLSDDLLAAYGWVIHFANGEKVSSDAQVFSGRLYVGSYQPKQSATTPGACVVGGYGRQLIMNALTSAPLRKDDGSLLYPTSAYGGRSFGNVHGFGRGLNLIGGSRGIPMLGTPLVESQSLGGTMSRVYWYSVPER